MGADLLSYYPDVLKPIREFIALTDAENPELDLLEAAYEKSVDGLFVMSADEDFVSRWESAVGITPAFGDDLATRRYKLLVRMAVPGGYTERRLQALLDGLCGAGHAGFEVDYAAYNIWIWLTGISSAQMAAVYAMLHEVVPANLWMGTETAERIGVRVRTLAVTHSLPVSGDGTRCGTYPYEVKRADLQELDVGMAVTPSPYAQELPMAGTLPYAVHNAMVSPAGVDVAVVVSDYRQELPVSGTMPYAVHGFGDASGEVALHGAGSGYVQPVPVSGVYRSGEVPFPVSSGDADSEGLSASVSTVCVDVVVPRCGDGSRCGEK